MQQNEGRELVEYAVIAVLVSLGVTLLLSGTGGYLIDLWNVVTRLVVG
jgi:Flp pilus assembly pilin Flp